MRSLHLCRLGCTALVLTAFTLTLQAAEPGPAAPAKLTVQLPAGAKLTIGDFASAQTGASRSFVSPPLEPGKTYKYTIKATWTKDGKEHKAEREVAVQAGKEVTVNLEEAVAVQPSPPKSREFLFIYTATATNVEPGKLVRIWLPVPPTTPDQDAKLVKEDAPAKGKVGKEPKYGNQIYHVEAKAGQDGTVSVTLTYQIKRKEVRTDPKTASSAKGDYDLYLKPDKLVPIGGKPVALLEGKTLPKDQFELGKVMYDVVNNHMKYSKEGTGWGRGDAEWACDSKYGNCTDFHSVFIGMARSNKIPAKFEMGFSIPLARGKGDIPGYHCWAWFKPEGKPWIPVDISEANKDPKLKDYYFGNLTEDRVVFTMGRDIDLVPKQDGPTLNFLVYPYVEVDGKPHDKVTRKFGYEDAKK